MDGGDARPRRRHGGGGGSHSDRSAQAEELLFLRDCLGPLRARPGAVPEKVSLLGRRMRPAVGGVGCGGQRSVVVVLAACRR